MTPTVAQNIATPGNRIPRTVFKGGSAEAPNATAPEGSAPTVSDPGGTTTPGIVEPVPFDPSGYPSAAPQDPFSPTADVFAEFLLAAPKDMALIVLAAGVFFLGVILACLKPGRSSQQRRETAVTAPMTFLITGALWFPLLAGEIIRFEIPPIDSILAFFIDGGARGQMFAFGLVMLMGYHSATLFNFISGVLRKILSFLDTKVPAPAQPPTQPPANPPAG